MRNRRSIHLVSTQAVQPPEQPSNDRITSAEYFAEIVRGEGLGASIFHWIVQRVGSSEVLMWGQETDYADAYASAKSYLQSLLEEDSLQSA